MTTQNFKIGQVVNYKNGSSSIYQGIIVKIYSNEIIIVDDESGMILWNAGYAVGSCVSPNQIIK